MDYIPVYEGEDTDEGSVKLSPGRIQRTGAKSEPVVRQRHQVADPGTGHSAGGRAPHLGRDAAVRGFRGERRERHHRAARSQGATAHERVQSRAFQCGRRISLGSQCWRDRPGAEGCPPAAGEPFYTGAGYQGTRTHARNLTLHSLACPAGWRNPRAQRGERNAGRTRRRTVQNCRSSARLGACRHRRTRSRAGDGRNERHCQAARVSGPDVCRRGVADLSAPQRPNPHRPHPHRSAQSR